MATTAGDRMTAPVSTVPVVKAALVALIAGAVDQDPATGDPVVGVWYSDVGQNFPDDNIIVGKASQTSHPTRLVGGGSTFWMDEAYSIEIIISVHRGVDQPQPAEERVWHLAGLIANAVRRDPSLAGRVTVAWPASLDVEAEWIDDPGGWQAVGTMHVEFEATS